MDFEEYRNALALKRHRQARLMIIKKLINKEPIDEDCGVRMKTPLTLQSMAEQTAELVSEQNKLNSAPIEKVDEAAHARAQELTNEIKKFEEDRAELLALLQARNITYEDFVAYAESGNFDRNVAIREEIDETEKEIASFKAAIAQMKETNVDESTVTFN
ncbi:hypothetical protein L596_012305 [Steinernema carpocapsae]|uniref:Uncharacterized protein n=1 Tax=Steinernema carpocapsae TaxID=34508 RepID=A0A4U5NXI5_STECR|nr:hypothetical protein L596_012305 [Steinernema carpocapsae]